MADPSGETVPGEPVPHTQPPPEPQSRQGAPPSSSSSSSDTMECSIYYIHFPKSEVTTLPCGHFFHHECIVGWTQVWDPYLWGESRMQCPVCRVDILYRCGDIISRHHLRPGVKILTQELTQNCQGFHYDGDTHSVETFGRPLHPKSIIKLGIMTQSRTLDEAILTLREFEYLENTSPGVESEEEDEVSESDSDSDSNAVNLVGAGYQAGSAQGHGYNWQADEQVDVEMGSGGNDGHVNGGSEEVDMQDNEQNSNEGGEVPDNGEDLDSDHPHGPANTQASETGDPITWVNDDSDDESWRVDRPHHHNFRFVEHCVDSGSLTLDNSNYRKVDVAALLDVGKSNEVALMVYRLRDQVDHFEKQYPDVPVLISTSYWTTMVERLERLSRRIERFKRQHEGFIEINETAVAFRDEQEQVMVEMLDDFWEGFKYGIEQMEFASTMETRVLAPRWG